MKILIAEDDSISIAIMQKLLGAFGSCEVAVNGKEVINAFKAALDKKQPYDLICLDIMMPEMSGSDALKEIRKIEEVRGMVLMDGAFQGFCHRQRGRVTSR